MRTAGLDAAGTGAGTAIRVLGALGLALALSGCGGDSAPVEPSASTTVTPSAEPSGTPSAASTLSPEEQQAFEEATATALAYRQTIADLYSGARTNLNDLDSVATGDLLDRGLRNIQQGLAQGYRSEPQGVELVLVSAEPVSIDLSSPASVVVRACIDATELTDVAPDGSRTRGVREVSTYYVIEVPGASEPTWAVERETLARDVELRQC